MSNLDKELPTLKRRLTIAQKSGDPTAILKEVQHAVNRFAIIGWPDNWTNWMRAKDDAIFYLNLKG